VSTARFTATVAVVGAVAACGLTQIGCDGEREDSSSPVIAGDWSTIREEVLVKSCAFGSCHGGAQPAAHLDLSGPAACRNLVDRPSCLFPGRTLVAPRRPQESFFMAKLAGDELHELPETTCSSPTNLRMPFGAQPLPPGQLAQIEAWIAAGADCGDDQPAAAAATPGGGASPAASDPVPALAPPAVATLVAAAPSVAAGGRLSVTGALAAPAGPAGATVTVDLSDSTVLGAPGALLVPAGETAFTIALVGKRPGLARLTAAGSGTAPISIELSVKGLYLAEVFPIATGTRAGSSWVKLVNVSDAPIDLAGYRLTVTTSRGASVGTLGGILSPRSCFVVGGPISVPANGSPRYSLVWDFSQAMGAAPDLTQPITFALLDAAVDPRASNGLPVDAVAFAPPTAGANTGLGPDGLPLVPVGALPPPGQSALRQQASLWLPQTRPTPSVCQLF
jgi:hypothetical protein